MADVTPKADVQSGEEGTQNHQRQSSVKSIEWENWPRRGCLAPPPSPSPSPPQSPLHAQSSRSSQLRQRPQVHDRRSTSGFIGLVNQVVGNAEKKLARQVYITDASGGNAKKIEAADKSGYCAPSFDGPEDEDTQVSKPQVIMPQAMVTINVGLQNPKVFSVHKHLICDKSTFFARLFRGSSTNTITFENVPARHMQLLVSWLYNKKIETVVERPITFTELGNLWIMADAYGMPELQNSVIDTFYAEARSATSLLELTRFAYKPNVEGRSDKLQLRDLAVEMIAKAERHVFREVMEHVPPHVVTAVALLLKWKYEVEAEAKILVPAEDFHVLTKKGT